MVSLSTMHHLMAVTVFQFFARAGRANIKTSCPWSVLGGGSILPPGLTLSSEALKLFTENHSLQSLWEDFLSFRRISRHLLVSCLAIGLGTATAAAQGNNPVSIGENETLFSVFAAINNCGYDAELSSAD